ncbi:nitric oxide synthase, inducible-like [Apodemus sylvaticus]|uniref:nitric oxide synthase, inducible-like n=1 Tax=Apodemus sylvaticus TaxID=10129 RepID=UPI0022418D82|nr:nitric oxide synthase, inducible-like [Apodemus sylvaticus]
MREGLSSACDAARPRLCRFLRRIFGPKVANRVGPASPTTQDDPKGRRPAKHQNGSPQLFTGTAQNVPESQDKLHVTPSTRPQHVRIKNWGSGEILHDTLHHKATSFLTLTLEFML